MATRISTNLVMVAAATLALVLGIAPTACEDAHVAPDGDTACLLQVPPRPPPLATKNAAAEQGERSQAPGRGEEHSVAFQALLQACDVEEVQAALSKFDGLSTSLATLAAAKGQPISLSAITSNAERFQSATGQRQHGDPESIVDMFDFPAMNDVSMHNPFDVGADKRGQFEDMPDLTSLSDGALQRPQAALSPKDLESRWLSWVPWLLYEQNLTKLVAETFETVQVDRANIMQRDTFYNDTIAKRAVAYEAYVNATANVQQLSAVADTTTPNLAIAEAARDDACKKITIAQGNLQALQALSWQAEEKYRKCSAKISAADTVDTDFRWLAAAAEQSKALEATVQQNLTVASFELQKAISELNARNGALKNAQAANGDDINAMSEAIHAQALIVSHLTDDVSTLTEKVNAAMQVRTKAALELEAAMQRVEGLKAAQMEEKGEAMNALEKSNTLKQAVLVAENELARDQKKCGETSAFVQNVTLMRTELKLKVTDAKAAQVRARSALISWNATAYNAWQVSLRARVTLQADMRKLSELKEALERTKDQLQSLRGLKQVGVSASTHTVTSASTRTGTSVSTHTITSAPTERAETQVIAPAPAAPVVERDMRVQNAAAKEYRETGGALPWLAGLLALFMCCACAMVG